MLISLYCRGRQATISQYMAGRPGPAARGSRERERTPRGASEEDDDIEEPLDVDSDNDPAYDGDREVLAMEEEGEADEEYGDDEDMDSVGSPEHASTQVSLGPLVYFNNCYGGFSK